MIVENRIAGTRITVWDVLHHLENGRPVKEIAEVLGLSDRQVQDATDYIHTHKDELMKVHQQLEERNSRGNPPNVQAKLAAARARRIQWLGNGRKPFPGKRCCEECCRMPIANVTFKWSSAYCMTKSDANSACSRSTTSLAAVVCACPETSHRHVVCA